MPPPSDAPVRCWVIVILIPLPAHAINLPRVAVAACTSNLPVVAFAACGHQARRRLAGRCPCCGWPSQAQQFAHLALPLQAVNLSDVPVAACAGNLTIIALVVHGHCERGSLPVIALAARGHRKCGNSPVLVHAKKKLVLNYNRLRELACCRHGRLSYPPK